LTREMTPTKELAEFVAAAEYGKIPQSVVEASKLCLLDSIACGLGGSDTSLGRTIVAVSSNLGKARQSTIIGAGGKASCVHAAFANTSLMNMLDYDDTYDGAGHPGNTVVSPALAVGEMRHVAGKELITAIVLGYEVSIRLGLATRPSPKRLKDVFPVGHYALGAAAATCKLLGFDAKHTAHAFGLAASGAPIPLPESKLSERPMGWMKSGIGFNSVTGIMGAFLAEEGATSWQTILDGKAGFWKMIGSDRCNFDRITRGLGEEYGICDTSFKPYPCCRYAHTTLDAVRSIVEQHNIRRADIDKITVSTISLVKFMADYRPRSMVDAQFSLPYMISMCVTSKTPGPRWFEQSNLSSEKVLRIASKVRINTDFSADRLHDSDRALIPATVRILTKQGKTVTEHIDKPRSLAVEEVKDKFRRISGSILGREKGERIARVIERIDEIRNISRFAGLLGR